MRRVSLRKLLLFALNMASTLLTLFTGLRENPVVVLVTGRYDLIRARLASGAINYDIMPSDVVETSRMIDLKDVGKSYRFVTIPTRNPQTYGADRSTCLRVNSIKSKILGVYFDDFWGNGVRRTQQMVFSISAPHCDVLNLTPEWYNATCLAAKGSGNATVCGQHIFDNFDTLRKNRVIQMGVEADFGAVGVPFLRCEGRPKQTFEYVTDIMLYTSYWAGGSDHVEIQSSRCGANPVVLDAEQNFGLFKVAPLSKESTVVAAVDNTGWLVTIVSVVYGIVSICMVIYGLLATVLRARRAAYVPKGVRFLGEWRICKVLLPFMNVATHAPTNENRVVVFKGASFMASDVWMNHWLYILLSMLEALATLRTTYVVFQTGTNNLKIKPNFVNFVFTCSAITKMTWIICLVHSVLRLGCRLALQSLKQLKMVRPSVRAKLEWYVDASAMLMSYKLYSILLCSYLFIMQNVRKSVTFMIRQVPAKRGIYGGDANLAQFWGSEIVCDLVVTVVVVLASGIVLSSLALLTRYRWATRNGLMRLLQRRFVVVGWDAMVVLEALGIDPYNPNLVDDDGVCAANCSLGAVLQQLYTSGPSGHVTLAGDTIFLCNGFSKDQPKVVVSVKNAVAMGLCVRQRGNGIAVVSVKHTANTTVVDQSTRDPSIHPVFDGRESATASMRTPKSLFDRKLMVAMDGYVGKIMLVDRDDPGRLVKSATSAAMEYEVFEALAALSIVDIKPLLGNDKKLYIT